MGLGIITKGVGFLPVFFLIPVIIQAIRHKTPFSLANAVKYALGPLAMLAVIAMWLLPMLHYADISGNPDFTAYKTIFCLNKLVSVTPTPGATSSHGTTTSLV